MSCLKHGSALVTKGILLSSLVHEQVLRFPSTEKLLKLFAIDKSCCVETGGRKELIKQLISQTIHDEGSARVFTISYCFGLYISAAGCTGQ